MSEEVDPQQEPDVNPWETWESAGFAPSEYDPVEVRNAWDGWSALSDRDQRPYLLERMLQGNEIPEGMSVNELSEAANLYWQAKNDPFGNDDTSFDDPQQYQQQYQQQQYQQDGGGFEPQHQYQGDPQYSEQSQRNMDPNYLQSVWQQDIESAVDRRFSEMDTQYQERQQLDEFKSEMDRVRSENNLSDSDLQFIAPRAVEYIQPGQPVSNAVKQAFGEFDEWRRNSLANYAQQQGRAPQTHAPTGFSASPDQPPRSLAEAQEQMMQRLSNG